MQRVDSLEKTLMLGGIGGRRRRGWQRMRWLDAITDSMDMSLVNSGDWWWTVRLGMLWIMGSQRVGHDWAGELSLTHQKVGSTKPCFQVHQYEESTREDGFGGWATAPNVSRNGVKEEGRPYYATEEDMYHESWQVEHPEPFVISNKSPQADNGQISPRMWIQTLWAIKQGS